MIVIYTTLVGEELRKSNAAAIRLSIWQARQAASHQPFILDFEGSARGLPTQITVHS